MSLKITEMFLRYDRPAQLHPRKEIALKTQTAILALIVLITGPATAKAEPGSVKRGAAAIEQWCRLCHLRTTDTPKTGMGPPFEQIVRRPGRNRAYFESFMKSDHFPMTTFRLFEHEKADVVNYLDWLSKNRK